MKSPPSTPSRHGTASSRVPYKAQSTPPLQPQYRMGSPTPLRASLASPTGDQYPESPTRSQRSPPPLSRRRSKSSGIAAPLGGYGNSRSKSSFRLPRLKVMIKRGVVAVLFCSLVLLLVTGKLGFSGKEGEDARWSNLRARWRGEEEDKTCRFVSPVEAYKRDLVRLHKLFAGRETASDEEDEEFDIEAEMESLSNRTHQAHHTFSPTGHLHVSSDPSAPHPIPVLLALGENRWEELLSRQSTTLEEAVEEYKRRYGRNPPRGFDTWWDFATSHNLVLPDEYDRINLDLAPFFALPKSEMKRRMEMVENMPETFTIVVKDGLVEAQILDPGGLKWDGTAPRARDAASLLEVFARFLPDLKATFSIFDQPQIYLSWARRASLMNLGLTGEHTKHLQETDDSRVRLSRSCPPDSNLRSNGTRYSGKSFIYDSLEAGDLCQNPYQVPLHGLTLEPHGPDSHPKPHTQLLPLFSLAKTSINSDILITPLDQFHDKPGPDPKWEDKSSSKLAWRGSPTGISMMTQDLNWRSSHRVRLHHFANNASSEQVSYLVPQLPGKLASETSANIVNKVLKKTIRRKQHSSPDDLGYQRERGNTADVMDFYYDMALAGAPLQCSNDDGTCDDMWREINFAPFQSSQELNRHKFLFDIDGNGWSGRFRRLMSTNSVVIKASLFTEWYQPHLIPWFMYIPTKLDFSDLTDILAFFRGTPKNPDLAFDETAKALARNGQCFAQRMFRLEDLQAYMMRLFLEYARIAADEGVDMDFHLEEELQDTQEDAQEDAQEHTQQASWLDPQEAQSDPQEDTTTRPEMVQLDGEKHWIDTPRDGQDDVRWDEQNRQWVVKESLGQVILTGEKSDAADASAEEIGDWYSPPGAEKDQAVEEYTW